ncbi:alpha/beta hydrolases superfamily protein, partial [Tanacetum coccineum]
FLYQELLRKFLWALPYILNGEQCRGDEESKDIEEKKATKRRKEGNQEKKGKSDRKCFRCGDPSHLIGDCPKTSRNKDQKAFIGGSWSDSENDAADKTNDKTCLMAQSLNEVCLRTCLEPDEWIKDSGCSKHMTGNKSLFSTYKAYDGGRERRKQAASFLITVGDEKNATRTQQHALFENRKLARRKVKECSKIGREHTKKASSKQETVDKQGSTSKSRQARVGKQESSSKSRQARVGKQETASKSRSKRHALEASLVEQEDIKARRLQHKYGGVESVSVALEVAFNEMEEDRVEIIKDQGGENVVL